MKKYFSLFTVIFLLSKIFILTSCAVIVPPGGGPKDSLPPVLVVSLPKDSLTSFSSNKILLTFDEYVQLDNIQENLVVSPNPEIVPVVESKLKTVSIRLKDSLLPNTTYTLNFGNAVKDVNEGNILKNFSYVFSTGKTLAHQTLTGKVLLAETGGIDSTLIVVLQKNLNDSAVKKLRPVYYTKLDAKGNFVFKNLPEETFNIYVLPNDYSKKYDDSTKLFAFFNSPVILSDSAKNTPLTLYAFAQFKEEKTPVISSSSNNDLSGADKKKQADEAKRLRLSTTLENNKLDILNDFQIKFSHKIKTFDSSKISLTDTSFKPVAGAIFSLDTSYKFITVKYKWPQATDYKIIIEKEAFTDSAGTTLAKADTLKFATKGEVDYGSITIRFQNLDLSKNPVLQIVQNNKIVDSSALTAREWHRQLYEPGEYNLRILYDENKNLTWDPGDFDKKKQPEIVKTIYKKITIKKDWENEEDINPDASPPPSNKQQQYPDNDDDDNN